MLPLDGGGTQLHSLVMDAEKPNNNEKTAILPLSFLGTDYKPGDVIRLKIDRLDDDQALVSMTGGEEEKSEYPDNPMMEEAGEPEEDMMG